MHGRGSMHGGACMAGGMHDRGHMWWGGIHGRGHAWQEACMVVGMHGRGHAWHTVNEQVIGGSKGGRQGRTPPLGVQILSFSCSFRQK